MVSASTTSVVGPLDVITTSATVAVFTALFWLTTSVIRVCGPSSTRDANILWLVLDHGCSWSIDNRMYALLTWQRRLSQWLMLVLCWMGCLFWFNYSVVIVVYSLKRSCVILICVFTASMRQKVQFRLCLMVVAYAISTMSKPVLVLYKTMLNSL